MKSPSNKKNTGFKDKQKEKKTPSVFDKAFIDPDKVKRQKEKEGWTGPAEERSFSKSIDDDFNPKYGRDPQQHKKGFTDKEKQKYKERFPKLAEYQERNPSKWSKKPDTDGKKGSRFSDKDKPKRKNDVHSTEKKPFGKRVEKEQQDESSIENRKFKSRFTSFNDQSKVYVSKPGGNAKNKFDGKDKNLDQKIAADYNPDAKMPLNKFIARSGICSRRNAVDIIKEGRVKVNSEIITEPGYKIEEHDQVTLDGKKIHIKESYVYILLNKPKGYITTLDDPRGRRIVSELYQNDIQERIFPVGRLDRNTTGLLLLTNDGDLSNHLAHPKYQIKKIYQVKLDKNVTEQHMKDILSGLELEDGKAEVDEVSYLDHKDEIGIEIHSGKNRIVRRIFEHLGYTVEKLDRVLYAGLTKKNLPKGKWRFLSRQEVINLKHLNKKIK